METRANYVIVGIFTLVAIAAAFGFIYWTAAIGDRGETAILRVRIPGSASGLGRGSAVLFNGVKVGDVQRVYIDVTNPTVAIADTEIDRLTPVTKSTKAVIGIAGLTGQANIEIKGSETPEPNILDEAEANGTIAEIEADPSAVTNLLQRAQDIFERADRVLVQLEGFTKDVRGPLTKTAENAQKFSDALGRNAEGVDKFLDSVSKVSDELAGFAGKLDGSIQAVENILKAVDPKKVENVMANVDKVTSDLAAASDQVDDTVSEVRGTIASINQFVARSQGTLGKVDGILESVDQAKIKTVVDNVDKFTGDLARASAQFDATLNEARKTVASINATAERVQTSLGKVDGLVDSVDRKKIESVVANVDKFTSDLAQTSAQFDDALREARGTIASINAFATRTQGTLGKVDGILDGVDPAKVRTALSNIEQASRSANAAAADIAKVTQKFGNKAEDIDGMISDTTQLMKRLNEASVRIDGVLAKVDGLLGSGEAEGLMSDAGETLKSFKQVADTLNSRLGVITEGLARFTGQGLRDAEALIRDSRRSITRIERAITDLERNPQRIITGGDGAVRQFDGRARR